MVRKRNPISSTRKGLTRSLAKKVGSLNLNQHSRAYLDGKGNLLSSSSELAVAKILQFAGISYAYRKELRFDDGSLLIPTFQTSRGIIVVDDQEGEIGEEVKKIKGMNPKIKVIVVSRLGKAESLTNLNSTSIVLDPDTETDTRRREAIFLDDPSFSFDYSHILPWTKKCSVLHGHTSAILLEVIGHPRRGMVVDFGDVKRLVKSAVSAIDHKLFISRKYLIEEDDLNYRIKFEGVNGTFDLSIPRESTFLLKGEATIENMADEVLKLIGPKMPSNVSALGVYIYEGLNKGSHLLASLRREE
jgi:6-pyruvoyltetrahydropterin/6-carboxytetrahydropterin synthase